jgi:PTH1 family peptidyl-tRNA hydrolase
MKLIFAQGNPGSEYAHSRHNVGFFVLDTLANSLDSNWADKPKFNATIAKATIAGEKVLLVKPSSFYNETGASARKIIDFYKLDPTNDLLVIHDDLALPFGTIRVRQQGSDAGNRGVKSINTHLDESYARIRIGTCNELREKMDDSSFVLGKFSSNENKLLETNVIPLAIKLVEKFCVNNLESTSYKTLDN